MNSMYVQLLRKKYISLREDRRLMVNYSVGISSVFLLVILALCVPNFFKLRNMVNILEQVSSVGFYALGLTCVMIVGGIDLSAPGLIMTAACLGGTFMVGGGNYIAAVIMMLLTGLFFGCINGLAIANAKMIPFIVTLSTLVLTNGIASYLSASKTVYGFPEEFFFFNSQIGIVPIGVFVFIICAVIISFFLKRTMIGRWYYMIGENIETARVSGVPTTSVMFSAYALSGLLAGIGSIFLTARVGSATANMVGETVTTDIIASCVIGGASLYGGQGSIIGSVLGLIFITVIGNCINLLGISYYIGMVIKGAIIAIVIGIDVLRSR
jgi:ribose transport system permease protein